MPGMKWAKLPCTGQGGKTIAVLPSYSEALEELFDWQLLDNYL